MGQLTDTAGNLLTTFSDPTALAEAARQLVAGGITPIAQGIAGAGAEAAGALIPKDLQPIPVPTGADVVNAVGAGLDVSPQTERGKAVAGAAAYPMEKLAQGAGYAGEKTLDVTGSPLAAAAVHTGVEALPFLLPGFKGRARVGVDAIEHEAAVSGERGPVAQGVATGEDIVAAANEGRPAAAPGDLAITDAERVPAEVAARAESPAAAMAESAGLPEAGAVPVPAPRVAEAAPGMAAGDVVARPPAAVEPAPSGNPITDRFAAKLQDHAAAVEEYSALPETEGGTVINTDVARELSPDYLADRTRSADVHEPASAFTKRLYAEKLAGPTPEGMEREVLFTAGGTGAGKTTGRAAIGETLGRPEIVYDTNMNSIDSARAKIEQALAADRKVKILYTYRDPVEALTNGALQRAMRQEGEFGSGRTVPIEEHLKTHLGAFDTVHQLLQDFHENPNVEVYAIDNSRGRGNAKPVDLSEIPNPHREGLDRELADALENEHAAGRISDEVYSGFKGQRPRPRPGAELRGHPESSRYENTQAPDYETQLDRLRGEIGWEDRGGRMIRGAGGEKGFGDVTGRTKWVEKSDFWPRYRTNDANPLTEREAIDTFRKKASGLPLSKRERRFMDFAGEIAAERVNDYHEHNLHYHETMRTAEGTETRASIREAARAETPHIPEGTPHAGEVRSNPRPVRREGNARAGSENARGENIQRHAQAGEPVPEPVRSSGKERDHEAPEVAPGETGIYNAHVAEERARRGLEAVKHDLSRSDPVAWEAVQKKVDADPGYAKSVTADYAKRPRPASKEDAIAIILDRQRIKNERREAYDDAVLSVDAGNAERAASARQRIEALDAEMEVNDYAAKATGHEWAEAGRARQLMSRDDYSMAEMVRRAKAKKGAQLTPAEMSAIEKSAKRIEELETRLAKAEEDQRASRARAKNPIAKMEGRKKFDALAAELKKIRDKDQMTPGCVV